MVKRLYKDPSRRGMILDDRCHYQADDYYCPAYPDGIPDELLLGKVQHDQVRKDQTGNTVFEEVLD